MLFVWGRRWYGRKLGFVADFCEICRRPQACHLESRTLIGHFWFIPMGTHYRTEHRAICTQCGTGARTEATRYTQPARKAASARELLARTHPGFDQAWGARMVLERKVRENAAALTPEQRRSMLAAPFVLLSPEVERRFAQSQFDWRVALAGVSVMGLPFVASRTFTLFSPDNSQTAAQIALAVGLGLLTWQWVIAKRRWVRETIVPRLARNLAPLRPTRAEIDGILGEMRQHKHKLGAQLKANDLSKALAKPA